MAEQLVDSSADRMGALMAVLWVALKAVLWVGSRALLWVGWRATPWAVPLEV